MPMVYADEPDAIHAAMGLEGSIVTQALTSIGLKDPISHYEGEMPLPQVYAKYSANVARYQDELRKIPRSSAQQSLQKQLDPLVYLSNALAPAFAAGAEVGARDRARLADLVSGTRAFQDKLRKARKTYGIRPLDVGVPAPAAPVAEGDGIPILPIAAIAAAFLLLR